MPRPKRLLAIAPLLALVLMACNETGGVPSANPTQPSAPSQTEPPDPSDTGDVFAGLDECEVLNTALDGEGYEPGKLNDRFKTITFCNATKLGDETCTADNCEYDRMGVADVGLGFQPHALDELDLDTGKTHKGDVNGRDALLIKNPAEEWGEGACMILIDVGKSNYAVTLVTLENRDTNEACGLVEQVAKRVEPQLPRHAG